MNFLVQTIRQPKYIGAVAPSSKYLARLITNNAQLAQAKTVVELGPGTGVFTEEIAKNINKDTNYFAIERNKYFIKVLRKKYPEVNVVHGSAEDLRLYLKERDCLKCDRVISGLPWSAFDTTMQERLLTEITESLACGGLFLTFSYYPFNHSARGKSFKEKLNQKFREVKLTKVVLNFPPAFVYICKK